MKHEDLFLAIGSVEESRLLRSELSVSSNTQKEEISVKRPVRKIIRNLLIAAVVVSMLAVTAYAVAGFLLYDNPQEMIAAVFGDHTGFDHSDGGIYPDPFGGPEGILVEPAYDRVPVDETVVGEDIAPYVDPVGKSVSFCGYTLTVDAFVYDSATRCGFLTYLLENPDGLPEYKLQSTGEIWYDGMPDIVQVNQYGYPYLIQEKTTDTCLAATYYFQWDSRHGNALELWIQMQEQYSPEEFEAMVQSEVLQKKQVLSPGEAVDAARQLLGQETFDQIYGNMTDQQIQEECYLGIVGREVSQRLEAESRSESIVIPLNAQQSLKHITAGDGSITLSPVAARVDVTNLDFLHTDQYGMHGIDSDNIDSLAIRYADGTEYTVMEDYTLNYVFAVSRAPEENVQTEIFVSPEEDPNGEGYAYVENSHGYCLLTVMFNRIVDVDMVASVVINGTELPVD